MVMKTHTIHNRRTVVVHLKHAYIASTSMMRSGWSLHISFVSESKHNSPKVLAFETIQVWGKKRIRIRVKRLGSHSRFRECGHQVAPYRHDCANMH